MMPLLRSTGQRSWAVASHPARKAAVAALVYVTSCLAYIWVSGWLASSLARDTEQLQQIETIKGTAFILITGLLFFLISFAQWKRIGHYERLVDRQQQALLDGERKAVAAMCTASLAHDLNNLLMSLSGLVSEVKEHEGQDPYLSTLRQEIELAIDTLSRLSKRLYKTASQALPTESALANLGDVARQAATLVRKHPDLRFAGIEVRETRRVESFVTLGLFEEALLNLLINAGQAAGKHAKILLQLDSTDGEAIISVHDNGPGVPNELRRRVFDPCFTTKSGGSGIGLVAVKTFAASHDGRVEVSASPLGGAVFEIRFPIRELLAPASPSQEGSASEANPAINTASCQQGCDRPGMA